uniref:Uncharacterized protein n=1 Tax=Branchiostoma floridae TaxID=7739 RepID=C3XT28_BRAFL|eukprot:XP_002612752.1 hypothetical protein BRAFLDRAFT_97268 [Branchiostoma floridae]
MAWEHLMAEMGDSLIEINIPVPLAAVLQLIATDMEVEESVEALLRSAAEHVEVGEQMEDVPSGREEEIMDDSAEDAPSAAADNELKRQRSREGDRDSDSDMDSKPPA